MILEAPINPLSIGNVSYNILRELHRSDCRVDGIFPVGNNYDFTAYEPVDSELRQWADERRANAIERLARKTPVLKCWHIGGSESKLTDHQTLLTFYEVDAPTKTEIAIVKSMDHVAFSSSEAAETFKSCGCDNVSHVPLGFDEDFARDQEVVRRVNQCHFILVGKLETRKNTQRIIKLWLEKYGNNNDYQLTCVVNNPFFKKEFYTQIVNNILGGKTWSNLNFKDPIATNYEVAMLHRAADIDLSGISNGEGWGLPAFNSTCLGKWSVVSNCSGHSDWANEDNSILIETNGKQPCYDGMFFHEGQPFNQGSYHRIEDDAIIDGMERAVDKVGTINQAGLDLGRKLTYKNTVEQLLEKLS